MPPFETQHKYHPQIAYQAAGLTHTQQTHQRLRVRSCGHAHVHTNRTKQAQPITHTHNDTHAQTRQRRRPRARALLLRVPSTLPHPLLACSTRPHRASTAAEHIHRHARRGVVRRPDLCMHPALGRGSTRGTTLRPLRINNVHARASAPGPFRSHRVARGRPRLSPCPPPPPCVALPHDLALSPTSSPPPLSPAPPHALAVTRVARSREIGGGVAPTPTPPRRRPYC